LSADSFLSPETSCLQKSEVPMQWIAIYGFSEFCKFPRQKTRVQGVLNLPKRHATMIFRTKCPESPEVFSLIMQPSAGNLSTFVDAQLSDTRASQVVRNLVIEEIVARKQRI
jgi:hypothetical protein